MIAHKNLIFYLKCVLCLILIYPTSINGQDSLKVDPIVANLNSQIDKCELYFEDNTFVIKTKDRLSGVAQLTINNEPLEIAFIEGRASFDPSIVKSGLNFIKAGDSNKLYHISSTNGTYRIKQIPLWMSLLPPLVAILLALLFKEVIVSLIIGIWVGAFIAGGMFFNSIGKFFQSFFSVFDKYIIKSLSDSAHISIIVFSLLIGAMVALISKNGGMMGVVNKLSKYAKSAKSTQFITWLLGIAIFFDDYANTLIVGNTMRSVTDKFRISREKLAYIVDSTAAPVSAIAFITTWIGAELSYISDGMDKLGLAENYSSYSIFFQSLKYSMYPILTLAFILIIIKTGKDFGPMYKAEKRARSTGQVSPAKTTDDDEPNMEDLSPVKNAPMKWYYAAVPILTVIFMTIYGLLFTGFNSIHNDLQTLMDTPINESWGTIWSHMPMMFSEGESGLFTKLGLLIGAADSYVALLWASSAGLVVALAFTVGGRVMKLFDTMHWVVTGFKTMLPAVLILTLAWALAICTDELHTADYLSHALQGSIHPYMIPAVIFVLAAFIAFSTGSSWSTMAILYPIAIPTSYAICQAANVDPNLSFEILLCVISTVLSASVLGDHVSPISDTTILSSLASDCNHIDHVRTQIPYAMLVGVVSLIALSITILLGGGWLVSFTMVLISLGMLYLSVQILGKTIPDG